MRSFYLLVFGGLCAFSVTRATDWPQWRGAKRDLTVTGEILVDRWPDAGPRRLWVVDLPGEGYSEPVVVKDRIYLTGSVGGKDDRVGSLYALDTATGAMQWQTEYAPEWGDSYPAARTSPTVADGLVYVIGGQGHVVCLSPKNNNVVWRVDTHAVFGGRNIQWGIADSPLVYDGMVICQPGGDNASIVALDAKTGRTVWQSIGLSERSAYCSPALMTLNGKRQVVTMLEDHVVGVDAGTGKPYWKYAHRNKYAVHPNTPVQCAPNRVFVSSGYGYGSEMIEVSGTTCKGLWQNKELDNHFQGAAYYQDRVFTAGGNRFSCLDPDTGRPIYQVEGVKKASFCITPVGLITYDESGKVSLVKIGLTAGEVVSSFKADFGSGQHWSSPVVANGVLYVRHGKGLAAYAIGR